MDRWLFLLLFYCFVVTVSCGDQQPRSHQLRTRRSLTDLKSMMRAVIKHRDPSDFVGYGNYCGMSGGGATLDSLDQCCYDHDKCYTELRDGSICAFVFGLRKYFASYRWQMNGNAVECDRSDAVTACGARLCDCDKTVVDCFARNLDSYNPLLRRNRSIFRQLLDFAHESFQYMRPRDPSGQAVLADNDIVLLATSNTTNSTAEVNPRLINAVKMLHRHHQLMTIDQPNLTPTASVGPDAGLAGDFIINSRRLLPKHFDVASQVESGFINDQQPFAGSESTALSLSLDRNPTIQLDAFRRSVLPGTRLQQDSGLSGLSFTKHLDTRNDLLVFDTPRTTPTNFLSTPKN